MITEVVTSAEQSMNPNGVLPTQTEELRAIVQEAFADAPVLDMHTHLFAPEFAELNLWGIDELLTYHYLVAEYFRASDTSEDAFWSMSKRQQADAVWETLFVRNTPLSEAACGIITVLTEFDLNPNAMDLRQAREFFSEQDQARHLDNILRRSGVTEVVMTNDPFDAAEVKYWDRLDGFDTRFRAVVRLDCMLNHWTTAAAMLNERGLKIAENLTPATIAKLRTFLDGWVKRMQPVYMAVSLPDDFQYPEASARNQLIREVVLPACREHDLPLALMIGVRRQVNPRIRLAGDGVGRADLRALDRLCAEFPENRFLVTVLSRENQHELCVSARKFRNLMPFGCWWFVNNPSIIADMTRMRLEMLGPTFIPQHSDSRVLEQLIYKWKHSRRILADCLADSYLSLQRAGRQVTQAELERDVSLLLQDNFMKWTRSSSHSS